MTTLAEELATAEGWYKRLLDSFNNTSYNLSDIDQITKRNDLMTIRYWEGWVDALKKAEYCSDFEHRVKTTERMITGNHSD
jgi:hypothetical protein